MNYTELKERVANQLVSSELIPFIPTAIEFAEARLNRDPRLRVRERQATESLDAVEGTATIALPTDYAEARSVWLTAAGYTNRLEFLTVDKLQSEKVEFTENGRPKFFSIIGSDIELLPTPGEAYTVDLLYYKKIPTLSDEDSTNWLIDSHPDIYFYGTLIQASPYVQQEKRLPTWQEMYNGALEELNIANERAEFSGGVLKVRPPRQ